MTAKTYAARTAIGIFALAEDGSVVKEKRFESPEDAARDAGKPLPAEFAASMQGPEADAFVRMHFRRLAKERVPGLNAFIIGFAKNVSLSGMQGKIEMDRFLIQAGNALEDMRFAENSLLERFTEWYRLHYPESRLSHRELLAAVLRHGRREKFPQFERSVGVDISDEDERVIIDFAAVISALGEQRRRKEEYLRKKAPSVMPNVCTIVDALLATRLLAAAGSLEKLAKMPSSTVQLLGAEKALFRHLKKKGKAPKYGLLFADARISGAPEGKRGKIARIISAKLAMAARIDFYSKRLDERLKKGLDEEMGKV